MGNVPVLDELGEYLKDAGGKLVGMVSGSDSNVGLVQIRVTLSHS